MKRTALSGLLLNSFTGLLLLVSCSDPSGGAFPNGEMDVSSGDPARLGVPIQSVVTESGIILASSVQRLLSSKGPSFLHNDHGENITLTSGEGGSTLGRRVFLPYGLRRGAPKLFERYGFSGQELDGSTGLLHYRYRELDPVRGNWVSPDPVFSINSMRNLTSHLGESSHGYTYVGNHPVNGIDPYGLLSSGAVGKAAFNFTAKLKKGVGLSSYSKVQRVAGAYKGEASQVGTTNHGRTYRTRYLAKKDRQLHKVVFHQGRMYVPSDDGIHRTLDTTIKPSGGGGPFFGKTPSSAHSGAGYAIFVQDPQGQVYVGRHDIYDPSTGKRGFHHSSFLAGAPVAAAGEMVVRNGVLQTVTPKSGHYQPTRAHMMNLNKQMQTHGIDTTRVQFQDNRGANMGPLSNPSM